MKGMKTLFSHANDEWETPDWLFEKLDKEFHFDCDAACTAENRKCDTFYDKAGNALNPNADWNNVAFLNPPYSQIAPFMKEAYNQSLRNKTIVCLIPARTDTRYWHDYCMKADEIRFIKGRLKFGNRSLPSWKPDDSHKLSSATFPSVVVIFRRTNYPVPKLGVITRDSE